MSCLELLLQNSNKNFNIQLVLFIYSRIWSQHKNLANGEEYNFEEFTLRESSGLYYKIYYNNRKWWS